jgi:hypothetical protein
LHVSISLFKTPLISELRQQMDFHGTTAEKGGVLTSYQLVRIA